MRAALRSFLARWIGDRRGSTATTFAVALVGLVGVSGAAIDYSNLADSRAKLQSAADAGALAGAKEFRLGNASAAMVTQVAQNAALANLKAQGVSIASGTAAVSPRIDSTARTVTVAIDLTQRMMMGQIVGFDEVQLSASATAKVIGGAPVCVVGLDTEASQTILLDKTARLDAPNCSVYSNSTKNSGITAKNSASLRAAFICSAGGKDGTGPGSFQPTPQTDCPILQDPLAARPQPTVGGCLRTNLELDGVTTTLTPGTYCGGILITNGARITMQPGIYVIKDAPLRVTGNGSLTGTNVGFFMTGSGAEVQFDTDSIVSLTAPRDGLMAGILLFEDRNAPINRTHSIISNNARNLLGTIYLSRGRLHVAANRPVADQSAYTIVVARQFTLSEGPTMVLNTNYGATDVPVPAGVGPNANRTALIN